jgi:hypothetical protein
VIVSVNLEINARATELDDHEDEEFETNALCPADVSSVSFPTWDELPSTPSPIDENADPVARVSIRVGMKFMDGAEAGYGMGQLWRIESLLPPAEVCLGVMRRGARKEMVVFKYSQHALEVGEVGLA